MTTKNQQDNQILQDMDLATNLGGCLGYALGFILALIACAVITLCTSCTTTQRAVSQTTHDTLYVHTTDTLHVTKTITKSDTTNRDTQTTITLVEREGRTDTLRIITTNNYYTRETTHDTLHIYHNTTDTTKTATIQATGTTKTITKKAYQWRYHILIAIIIAASIAVLVRTTRK